MTLLPHQNYLPSADPIQQSDRPHPQHKLTLMRSGVEIGIKLGINVVLASIAISSLVKIAGYSQSQQANLTTIRTEVVALQGRVDQLQIDFQRDFDPRQAITVMQEESDRIDPRQRQVSWIIVPNSLVKRSLKKPPFKPPAGKTANFRKFNQSAVRDQSRPAAPDAPPSVLPLPQD